MKRNWKAGFAILGMAILIFDTNTALSGCKEGVRLCINSVIPSLFPFILLSRQLTAELTGRSASILSPLGKLLRIPPGSELLPLIGLLGGYPSGAQGVYIRWQQGALARRDAERMLGFCSNCGPAFIFGIGVTLLGQLQCWMIWLIHILSAILTALLLPGGSSEKTSTLPAKAEPAKDTLVSSLKVMATVCGWVTVFKILLAYLAKPLQGLPYSVLLPICGLLEMTNGCLQLSAADPKLAFLLFEAFVTFGGLCVAMQTVSVCGELGTGLYFPGKLLQLLIALALSSLWVGLQPGWCIAFAAAAATECRILRKKSENNSRNKQLNPV